MSAVDELLSVVEELAERVERLERGEEPGTHPALWLFAEDVVTKAEADGAWAQFVTWVVRLQRRYELGPGRLPACWHRHPPVVEELVALWIGHVDAYIQGGYAPMSWHDGLERSLNRIKGMWASACLSGTHENAHSTKAWELGSFTDQIAAGAPSPWATAAAESAENLDERNNIND